MCSCFASDISEIHFYMPTFPLLSDPLFKTGCYSTFLYAEDHILIDFNTYGVWTELLKGNNDVLHYDNVDCLESIISNLRNHGSSSNIRNS